MPGLVKRSVKSLNNAVTDEILLIKDVVYWTVAPNGACQQIVELFIAG